MILVVDDNEDVGRVLCRLLGRCGYPSHYCPSGAAALEFVEAERPSLAILDVMMPGMDGLSLLEEMRNRPGLDEVPTLFYSASTAESHRRRAEELKADAFLVKGATSITELLGMISQYESKQPNTAPVPAAEC